MGWREDRARLLAGEAVAGPTPESELAEVTPGRPRRPLLPSTVDRLVRASRPDAPWRTRVEVHAAGEGWLAATDPTTGEVHEIRTEDAPYAWYAAVWGRDGA